MTSLLGSSVYFSNNFLFNEKTLELLESLPFSESGTRRLCFHNGDNAPLHVMLLESALDIPFPIHRHNDCDEFILLISGKLEMKLWGGVSSLSDLVTYVLSDEDKSKGIFIKKGLWHSTRALEKNTKYLEVKCGPYDRKAIEFWQAN